jgi:hypothetical protein
MLIPHKLSFYSPMHNSAVSLNPARSRPTPIQFEGNIWRKDKDNASKSSGGSSFLGTIANKLHISKENSHIQSVTKVLKKYIDDLLEEHTEKQGNIIHLEPVIDRLHSAYNKALDEGVQSKRLKIYIKVQKEVWPYMEERIKAHYAHLSEEDQQHWCDYWHAVLPTSPNSKKILKDRCGTGLQVPFSYLRPENPLGLNDCGRSSISAPRRVGTLEPQHRAMVDEVKRKYGDSGTIEAGPSAVIPKPST